MQILTLNKVICVCKLRVVSFKWVTACFAKILLIRYFTAIYSDTSVYVLNPFQILGLIPKRTYAKRIFTIRNKGKMINPFPRKKSYCHWHIILYIDGVV
jgi:hypothetical protein